jgi:HAD superfamily hydrolase (TIGR01509 family)
MSMPAIQAVLFDFDDTLADSGGAWNSCWTSYARRHGHEWTAADRAACTGTGGWVTHLAGLCGLPAEQVADECIDEMLTELDAERVELLVGAQELVMLASTSAPVGVVSAAPRRYVRAAVERLGLAPLLSVVLGNEDVPRTKPDPAPYLHAAAMLGVDPRRCLVVEDSTNGIRAALDARMSVLAIPNTFSSLAPELVALTNHCARTALDAYDVLAEMLSSPLITEAR